MTKARLFWTVIILFFASLPAMYFLNPFHTVSRDPRARILGVTIYRIPAVSMEPTLREGSLFMVNVAALRNRDPRVGEIIVFQYPPDPRVEYIKRVIATGGSTVEMRHGEVWLDGKKLDEPWLPALPFTEVSFDGRSYPLPEDMIYHDLPPMEVPDDHFFVLGDNRGNSSDSRMWGFVPRDHVIGIVAK